MPEFLKPSKLSQLCLKNIAANIDTYWLNEENAASKVLDAIIATPSPSPGGKAKGASGKPKYILGPFEALNDEAVHSVLQMIYLKMKKSLSTKQLLLLFHNRLRMIDLRFITNLKFTLNSTVCAHIGNNCFNLIELNLFAQKELSPKNLVDILQSMRKLKRLDLSHTKANLSVCTTIASTCQLLEHLYLDNCKGVYDDCVNLFVVQLNQTLSRLGLDNIYLSDQCIKRVLVACEKLTYLQCENLVRIMKEFFDRANEGLSDRYYVFEMDTLTIDPQIQLKPDVMQMVSFCCPKLKKLTIHTIGSNPALETLGGFSYLTELVFANTNSLISFSFDGQFLDAVKGPFGKQLRKLHMVHIRNVNLRSVAKHCPNLTALNVEFLCYYEPALDESLLVRRSSSYEDDSDTVSSDDSSIESTVANMQQVAPMAHLTSLVLVNSCTRSNYLYLNIGQFKKDIELLVANCQLKHLHLQNLNELDDEFMLCLFTKPASTRVGECHYFEMNGKIQYLKQPKYAHQTLEKLELNQMNQINYHVIVRTFFSPDFPNTLKWLVLDECKKIKYSDMQHLRARIERNRLDCQINWS